MTDRKPRINVTVDDDMNELIAELAALQGIPKATLITQYLDMLRPHMVEIRDAIRMVNDKKTHHHTSAKCFLMVSKNSLTY